jgi:hypothetical protein
MIIAALQAARSLRIRAAVLRDSIKARLEFDFFVRPWRPMPKMVPKKSKSYFLAPNCWARFQFWQFKIIICVI